MHYDRNVLLIVDHFTKTTTTTEKPLSLRTPAVNVVFTKCLSSIIAPNFSENQVQSQLIFGNNTLCWLYTHYIPDRMEGDSHNLISR